MIEVATLLVVGPLVGVEFGVAAVFNPLVAKLPDAAFRQARGGGSRLLGAVMPFWYLGALALLIAAAALSRSVFAVGAVALMVVAVLLTVTTLVPINNRIGRWQTDADVSRELASRWDRLHWLRVALLAALFLLVVISAR
ncbi:DUF1772 domain-containing protein [Mycolicibacterium sp. P9-64]|uniref:anthrone oxygenase family protein n=1 Tax=Mycolicibacterium sp. P9-64 TaxID=2024612 RepID=UPI0011EBE56A|nr:anthrone oxygenase family protein [Mycolicibacterium sp. P9-64]KAA0079239.1 DUF1772 domain-containing protein [Mycolicibacterium sp. P9-64]